MLHYAIIFLVIAIIAAIFGFSGLAGTAAWIAHVLFVVFLVLFLFIIMLLDLKTEARRKMNMPAVFGGVVVLTLFVKVLFDVSYGFQNGNARFPALSPVPQGDVWHIGMTLFQSYKLPLQVVGTLVLVASVGVVLLSKR